MAFLVLAAADRGRIDPEILARVNRAMPVTWFAPDDPGLGGVISLSPLATVSRLRRGDRVDCLVVGRIRLDRRDELRAKLMGQEGDDALCPSDADLCLAAYQRWGAGLVEHIHGDFAFVIYDNVTRELLCARDRFGIRMLAWRRDANSLWIAGSMQDLVATPGFHAGELDPVWISDFLREGVCNDPARSVYSAVHRLAPAHVLSVGPQGLTTKRYWSLAVGGPLQLASPAAYAEEFHARLDAAMRDRLPSDRVGLFMSGGLDSSTLAAKCVHLAGPELKVIARTWLIGGQSDPEAQASARVAEHLGLQQIIVNGDRLLFDSKWQEKPAGNPEPDLAVISPSSRLDDAKSMRSEAACWLYGEGPDNALTFEWQMHLHWLVRQGQWARLPSVLASYLVSKSLVEWRTTVLSRLKRKGMYQNEVNQDHAWVRGDGSRIECGPINEWRPKAHANLSSALWPSLFEMLETEYAPLGIEWRYPFMDLRVMEFLLATPPIPWARRKRLIRVAMKGQLPAATLRRDKTPLHRDNLSKLLRKHLPAMPRSGDAVEQFVDIGRLPEDPPTHPDIYALTRVAILQHWLKPRHG